MWHTPLGDRIVEGAEANLIRASIETLASRLLLEDDPYDQAGYQTGVEIFDRLTRSQKLAAIEHVARHMLVEATPPPPLNASSEAVIGALFLHVSDRIEDEIVRSTSCNRWLRWRAMTRQAAAALIDNDGSESPDADSSAIEIPTIECDDFDQWRWIVELLAEHILWDRDYELAEMWLDLDPQSAEIQRGRFGIDENYFTDTPPDPRDDQLDDYVSSIEQIVRKHPK
jgi:hypothetical protein